MASIDYSKVPKILLFCNVLILLLQVFSENLHRLRKPCCTVLEWGLSVVALSLLRDSCSLLAKYSSALPFLLSLSQETVRAKSVFVEIESPVDSVGMMYSLFWSF